MRLAVAILPLTLFFTDYYEILGVAKDADDRTIRKAFKKLAIQKHPDKNKDNPEAHAEFLKINRAYEVLKDEELRKKFDQYGEKGLADDFNPNQNFQSWQFYNDNFGIYDDDVEIVTLNRADFNRVVQGTGEIWFINFYSTFCSHCHQLAPTWRKFAAAMDGVIRVGAVNCAEDPGLCQSQHVHGYPSLVWYPEGTFYQGPRDLELIVEFVMTRLPDFVIPVTHENYLTLSRDEAETAGRPWIIDFCDDSDRCLTPENRRKLASMLYGLVNVGTVDCHYGTTKDKLCEKFDRTDGVLWFDAGAISAESATVLESLDPKELASTAIKNMDGLPEFDEDDLKSLFDRHIGATEDTVVWFVKDQSTVEENKEMLPTTILFKANGGYEINYATSKTSWRDQALFIRESLKTPMKDSLNPSVVELTPEKFRAEVLNKDAEITWVVDFFAPWCGPCQQLAPEFNRAARMLRDHDSENVKYGSIDCQAHRTLCDNEKVTGYPTVRLFPASSVQKQRKLGKNLNYPQNMWRNADSISQWTMGYLPSLVVPMGNEFFTEVLDAKTPYLVDFYAPWCGPCMRFVPVFDQIAKALEGRVQLVKVDCDQWPGVCQGAGIQAYPSIRLYRGAKNGRRQDGWGISIQSQMKNDIIQVVNSYLGPVKDEL
ncbi:unnamed protein product, partial [Mesorhabditis spiculigera]